MDRPSIKKIVIDQQEMYRLPDNYVERTISESFETLEKSKQVIVITGIRRCGKSTIIAAIRDRQKERKKSNYFLNFDDDRLVKFVLEDFQALYEIFIELYGLQKTFYFDEIQNIPEWERFVRRLHDEGNKIYITGSNATLFSKELGTRLTGRYIQINLYPFSFYETIQVKHIKLLNKKDYTTREAGLLKRSLNHYCVDGGIPEYIYNKNSDYFHSLFDSIIYRDIIVRYKLSREKPIRELVYYLASNIGKHISYNKLSKLVGLASATTIADYCDHLENSFLCFFINKYDVSLKKQIYANKKAYFIDHAFARSVGFAFSHDRGRLLENIVFIELLRRKNEIYYHQGKYECDFILKRGLKITTAIQVTQHLDNDETKQREYRGLTEAMLAYQLKQGIIITEDTEDEEKINLDGKSCQIKVIPIWKWLLSL